MINDQKLHKLLLTFILLSIGLGLSGCTPMNSGFDCPMKSGVMCKSLDQVNAMVDQGDLGAKDSVFCPHCESRETTPPLRSIENLTTDWDGKTRLRVWMAPYEDAEGNEYAATRFYTPIHPEVTNKKVEV